MQDTKNAWHASMYDPDLAKETIDSAEFSSLAKKEASLIVSHLALKSGCDLLDVPCGTGRHAAIFAARGINVTGVDINPSLLEIAASRYSNINFEVGDMTDLAKYRGRFDVTINLFSSLGYFEDDAANMRVLHEIYATLRPGGVFVLHLIERDWLMGIFQSASWKQKNGELVIKARRFNEKTNYLEEQQAFINQSTGKARTYYHRMRLYAKDEMVVLLEQAGFKKVEVYGDAEGNPFQKHRSTHPFYFAWK